MAWTRAPLLQAVVAVLIPVLVASLDDFDATSALERRERVGDALDHAYRSWRRQCWGLDEVRPRTGGCTNGLLSGRPGWPRPAELGPSAEESGLALTLIDSLDTLWLAGRRAEFEEAREWVRSSLSFDVDAYVSVFELTIRGLGGLLAAHWLTHEFGGSTDSVFLDAAYDLGKRLLPAFDHPQRASGVHPLPYPAVNLRTGAGAVPVGDGTYAHGDCASCSAEGLGVANASVPISEAGSLAIEFGALSILTGDPRFAARADAVAAHIDALPSPFRASASGARAARKAAGLVPTHLQWANGFFASPVNELTFSAFGDSYYEYLLKIHALRGVGVSAPLRMYRAAAEEMVARLVVAVPAAASAPAAPAAAPGAVPSSPSAARIGATRYVLARRALDARGPPSNTTTRDTHHLACFVPGMLSLAALEELAEPLGIDAADGEGGEGGANGRNHGADAGVLSAGTATSAARLDIARELLRTCVDLYRLSPSGLAPESVELRQGGELGGEFITLDPSFHLRPELVESLFMWSALAGALRRDESCRASSDATCAAQGGGRCEGGGAAARRPALDGLDAAGERDDAVAAQRVAWRIFRAIEKHCRAPHGYGGVEDVRAAAGNISLLDVQPSFFLAETLKYLYLIFSDESSLGVGMSERDPQRGLSAAAKAARAAADGSAIPTHDAGGTLNHGVDVQTLLRRGVFSTEAHPLPRLTEVLNESPGAAALALPDEAESAALSAAVRSCAQRFGGSFRETCAACATGWQHVGDDPRWACALRCYCPDGSGALRATMCATYARDVKLSNQGGRLARNGAPCSAL